MTRHGINLDTDEIRAYCRRWRVAELSAFGSILRDDFQPESDVDLLVTFLEGATWDLLDFLRMQDEATAIVGRRVDLVSRRGIEDSANRIVRRDVLASAQVLYAQR